MFLVLSLRFEIKEAGVAFLKNLYQMCVCVCVCVRERERERESFFTLLYLVLLLWNGVTVYSTMLYARMHGHPNLE